MQPLEKFEFNDILDFDNDSFDQLFSKSMKEQSDDWLTAASVEAITKCADYLAEQTINPKSVNKIRRIRAINKNISSLELEGRLAPDFYDRVASSLKALDEEKFKLDQLNLKTEHLALQGDLEE